jgi:hypothetical protein
MEFSVCTTDVQGSRISLSLPASGFSTALSHFNAFQL